MKHEEWRNKHDDSTTAMIHEQQITKAQDAIKERGSQRKAHKMCDRSSDKQTKMRIQKHDRKRALPQEQLSRTTKRVVGMMILVVDRTVDG